jgi:hypothetical protein
MSPKKKPTKAKTKKIGRPLANIDVEQLKKLAMLQCTMREIAAFFGVDASTIQRRFATEIAIAAENGKISLRRSMWTNAITQNNTQMQIHLSKNHLGMVEHPEREKPQTTINLNARDAEDACDLVQRIQKLQDTLPCYEPRFRNQSA